MNSTGSGSPPSPALLAGLAFGVGLLVYVSLNLLAPFKTPTAALPAGPSAEAIFASSIERTPPAGPAGLAITLGAPSVQPRPPAATAPLPRQATAQPQATPAESYAAAVAALKKLSPGPKPPASAPPQENRPASAEKPWWPAARPGRLNLVWAGAASQGTTLALLFDQTVTLDAARRIRVFKPDGSLLKAAWKLSGHRRGVYLTGLPKGRYWVVIPAGMSSATGLALGVDLRGAVILQ